MERNAEEDGSSVDEQEDFEVEESSDAEEREDEERAGEGEEPPPPKPVVSYEKASSMKFFTLVKALEQVWIATHKNRKKGTGPKDIDKLQKILPAKALAFLDEPSEGSNQPESIFPIYRLLMPDKDTSRRFRVAEKRLAQMYAGVLGLSKNSDRYKMLFDYGDPKLAGGSAGDFPSVVGDVVSKTKVPTKEGSSYTVGDINAALDKFCSLYAQTQASNHDFKKDKKKVKPPKLQELRMRWLEDLNRDSPGHRGLTAVEHKWLVRILTNQMRVGVGWGKLLEWYDPLAKNLWSSHNSLKAVLDKLCDEGFAEERK